jgi:hypothetical protein
VTIIMSREPTDSAFIRAEKIKSLKHDAERTFLKLGQELYEFVQRRDFKALGVDTFEEWIAQPDVNISRTLAYRLMGIYETFILQYEVPLAGLIEAGSTKLDKIRPQVVDKASALKWVNMASALSKSDLDLEIDVPKPPNPNKIGGILFRDVGLGYMVLKRAYEAMPDWSNEPIEITIRHIGDRKDGNE